MQNSTPKPSERARSYYLSKFEVRILVNVKFECTPVARIWFNTELVEFLSCSQPVLCPQEHESFVVVRDCIVKHHVSNSNRVEFRVDNLEGFFGDCHNCLSVRLGI